jgi:hypothetical protein
MSLLMKPNTLGPCALFIIGLILAARWLLPDSPNLAGAIAAIIGCALAMFMQWRFDWFPGKGDPHP